MAGGTVFVSGASGFVGSAVLRSLLRRDYRIHALAHRRPLRVLDPRITVFKGEADDPEALNQALAGASAAIHLVGIIAERPADGVTFGRMHVDFTRTMVDACVRNGVQRYLHMSALGARSDSPSVYHQTKAAAEQIVQGSPLAWTIIRPSLIHGPDGEFTAMLLDWSLGRKPPWLFMPYFGAGLLGHGRKALVQPVLVDDVARVLAEALEKPLTIGKYYEVAGAQQLTWPDLYRTFARAARGRAKPTLPIPAWYALALARIAPEGWLPFNRAQVLMSQEDSLADLGPLAADFGFTPLGFEAALALYAPSLAK